MVRTDTKKVTYDEEAEASGWYGPEVAFGLAFKHVMPGQSILDIEIGTGLGSVLFRKAGLDVHGIDISSQMLDVSCSKGFGSLQRHDLRKLPYPYESESMHHAICITDVFGLTTENPKRYLSRSLILYKINASLIMPALSLFLKTGAPFMGWLSRFFNNEQVPPEILPRKNDPCWCGSGSKYKKCHLAKDRLYFKEHPMPKKKVTAKKTCGPVFG
jgi:hypothetical protein